MVFCGFAEAVSDKITESKSDVEAKCQRVPVIGDEMRAIRETIVTIQLSLEQGMTRGEYLRERRNSLYGCLTPSMSTNRKAKTSRISQQPADYLDVATTMSTKRMELLKTEDDFTDHLSVLSKI